MGSRGSNNSVQLRNFCIADLDELYEWLSDEHVTKFTTWEAIESKERAQEILTPGSKPFVLMAEQGLATQAVEITLKNGLSELKGVERVEGLVVQENVASARVLEKAGFLNNGFFPKHLEA
ncbi:uncharacterized protein LOC131033967 [Cryptomeria japonica]|uniref:uncharacterized protein LOC131033967 n=1 Tax=Cryptomeria japonica TaxID=3369 RepID=UPI0027DA7B5F|nr:uncharacterized protein LOC131033967 [Cryptomeria japonica]